MKPWKEHDYSKWQEVPAVRTKVGTYPPGSEWAKIISSKDKASTYYPAQFHKFLCKSKEIKKYFSYYLLF